MRQFEGKVILITGAAGGLGVAMCRLLAERGGAVAVADIDADRAEAVARALREAGARAVGLGADITSEAEVERMIAATVDALGGLDVLVNNANSADPKVSRGDSIGFTNLTEEVWDAYMDVNARGTMLCCKHAIPRMIARGGGAIVNIVSVAGLKGGYALAAYGASKAAMISLTRHIAVSYGKQNIRCNAIAPGTTLHERIAKRLGKGSLDASTVLVNRLGEPNDIAYAVAYLASDEAGYVTGQVLAVDGGGTVGKITAQQYPPDQPVEEEAEA
jgi:NAD(P)-dependent dehydrogenase (short-subunit alcohol dehydrogenase family)